MMSDCTTRLLAARHLHGGEKTEEFIKHLERAWVRNFGPMRVLQVDERRAIVFRRNEGMVHREWDASRSAQVSHTPDWQFWNDVIK